MPAQSRRSTRTRLGPSTAQAQGPDRPSSQNKILCRIPVIGRQIPQKRLPSTAVAVITLSLVLSQMPMKQGLL